MKNFTDFLTEAKSAGPEHVHDLAIGNGNDGVGKAGDILDAVHRKLLGKPSAMNVTIEHDDPKHPNPVMVPSAANYTINDQRRYLDHIENAKRSFAKMKPDAMDAVNKHSRHLKTHLSSLSKMSEPPKTDGFVDYLTKTHKDQIDSADKSLAGDKKRHSLSGAVEHVLANRQHYDRALEVHHYLGRAKDVLASVIGKNYKSAGHALGSKGAVASGRAGTARFSRNR